MTRAPVDPTSTHLDALLLGDASRLTIIRSSALGVRRQLVDIVSHL
jgi:hypothetical protein